MSLELTALLRGFDRKRNADQMDDLLAGLCELEYGARRRGFDDDAAALKTLAHDLMDAECELRNIMLGVRFDELKGVVPR